MGLPLFSFATFGAKITVGGSHPAGPIGMGPHANALALLTLFAAGTGGQLAAVSKGTRWSFDRSSGEIRQQGGKPGAPVPRSLVGYTNAVAERRAGQRRQNDDTPDGIQVCAGPYVWHGRGVALWRALVLADGSFELIGLAVPWIRTGGDVPRGVGTAGVAVPEGGLHLSGE